MLAECVQLADKAERLLTRAQRAVENTRGLRSGDRVFTPLIAHAEFDQGTAASANLIFNVPADADFWAYRLLIYPQCKVVDPVFLTPDEIVYRPTSFAGQSATPGTVTFASAWSDINNAVDGTFALIRNGNELQNIDIPMAAAYCQDVGKWVPKLSQASGGNRWGAASQTPAGLVFDIPFFLERGSSLTCRITPTYLGARTITETVEIDAVSTVITRQHRYRFTCVLEGEKRVHAFR